MKKKIVIALIPLSILLIVAALGLAAIYKEQKKQSLSDFTNFDNNKIVPFPNFSLQNLYDGADFLSKNDLLEKYSLINVFASWCTTCRAEHELLMKISALGIIDIYGIAWRDIDENSIRYLEKNGNPYLKTVSDNDGELSKLLNVKGVPETFLIDKRGNIIYHYKGSLQPEIISYIEKLVMTDI